MPSDTALPSAGTPPLPSYRLVGVAFAAVGVLCFSLRPLLIKAAYGYGAEPVTLLALRMGLSLPFFVAMAVWASRRAGLPPIAPRDWALMAGLGFLSYYAASYLDFLGLQYVSAGIGRLLLFLYPTVVVVLSAVFLRKPVTRREKMALALTYVGVAGVLSTGLSGANADLPLGAALVFGSAVCYAIYLVMGSNVISRVGALRFTAWAMIVASIACLVQFLLMRPLTALDLPMEVYALSAVMATVSTVLPIFITAEALRRIGANQVALFGALGPVSTVVLGYFGLDERLTGLQILGSMLVLAGVLMVTLRPKR